MRNLEQYPITTDEIVQCLKELMDGVSYEKTGRVGDMRPLLLANAIQLISASASAQCAPTWDEKTVEFAASMIVGSSINGADFDPDCCECPKCEADREEVREMVRKILTLSAVTSTER